MKGKPSPRNNNRTRSSRRVAQEGCISRAIHNADERSPLPWEGTKTAALRKECTRPVEQEVLQREWESLGVEQKAVRRAQRAKRGERCSECGCVGYFRRNCPTCPSVRFDVKTGGWRVLSEEETQRSSKWPCAKTLTSASGAGQNRRHLERSDDGCDVDGHLQGVPSPGRGFLWGTLADEAARPTGVGDEHNGRRRRGMPAVSASVAAGGGGVAVVAEMPSLAGTSDLSSGAISGFRRALVWEDDSGAPRCPSVVSSLKDAFEGPEKQLGGDSTAGEQPHHHYHPHHHQNRTRHTNLHADVSELECSSHNDNDGDRDGGPAGPGVVAAGLESITDSISAGRSGGVGGVGGVGWTVGSRPTAEQELTWRWPNFCNEAAMQSPWSPNGGEQTHALSITSAGDGPLTKATTQPPQAPRESYLRLRDNKVLTVQENLHLALARLIEAARKQAHSVTSLPSIAEIMRSPRGGPPPERYYRPSTRKDFRDFFDAEEDEECRRQQPKAHAYLGSLREEGTLKYVFDRTSHGRRGSLAAHLWGDYQPQRRGYRGTTVHSVVAWRRLNTTLDRYASSGRETIRRVALSDEALQRQFVWVGEHKKAREQRRQRADHLLEVLRMELLEEQKREIEVLRLPRREQRLHVAGAMKDRLLAADRIIRTLRRYGLIENIEDAHYIIYALNAARRAGLAQKERHQVHAPRLSSSAGDDATASTPAVGAARGRRSGSGASAPLGATAKCRKGPEKHADRTNKAQQSGGSGDEGSSGGGAPGREGGENFRRSGTADLVTPEHDHGDNEISPYSVPLRPVALPSKLRAKKRMEPSKRRSATRSTGGGRHAAGVEGNAAYQDARRRHQKLEQLRTFRLAGHSIRRGVESDTTAVPALIPIPEGFGSGKVSETEQKSFAVGRIMEALRAGQIDPNTGRCANVRVPLWHRATEEIDSASAGSVLYSDLIGHTYSVLVGPRRVGKGKRNGKLG